MAGNIYIVYDADIETQDNLGKFKEVLIKATYEESLIKFIPVNEYLGILTDVQSLPPYTLCLNQTYKQVSEQFSKLLDIPAFEFSSKVYAEKSQNIILFGIQLDINVIFDTNQYKNYVWSTINSFYKKYQIFSDLHSLTLPKEEVVKISEVKESSKQVDIDLEEIMTTVDSITIPQQTKELNFKDLTQEELVGFFTSVVSLLDQFAEVKNKLEHLSPKIKSLKE